MPSVSPQHVTIESTKTITIKDFFDVTTQNINALIEEDLKKILDQSTLLTKHCDNPVLVSVEELQNRVTDTTRVEVNPQEPPSIIPRVSHVQPLVKVLEATLDKVDTIAKVDIVE